MAAKPDLLFLSQRIPYPPDKGEKIRYWPLLNHLSRSYNIHLGCLIDDAADSRHVGEVRALCADAHFVEIDARWSKLACLRGLLTGDALSVSYFANRSLARWVARVLREVRPAAIVVCSSNMAPYVLDRDCGDAARLFDLVDVDSEKWRSYSRTAGAVMRWVYRREWRKTAALEMRISRTGAWCTFVSSTEAALFKRLLPEAVGCTRAVENGVDHTYFDPSMDFSSPLDTDRAQYVFTGTMDYPPNVDAVIWFAYPKGTSKKYKSEINRDNGWQVLGEGGFEPVRMVAIDEDWSALRFRRVEHIKTMTRAKESRMTAQGKAR